MEVEGRICKMFLALSYTSSQARDDIPLLFSFHYKETEEQQTITPVVTNIVYEYGDKFTAIEAENLIGF